MKFLDTLQTEEWNILVTERVIPLEEWLTIQVQQQEQQTDDPQAAALELQVLWGIRCLLEAGEFLSNKCGYLHGTMSPSAIFIASNGDWKLGNFEVACHLPEEMSFLDRHTPRLVQARYLSPERQDATWKEFVHQGRMEKGTWMDIYGLGATIQYILETLSLHHLETELKSILRKMMATKPQQRSHYPQILQQRQFHTTEMELLAQINETALHDLQENLELFRSLSSLNCKLSLNEKHSPAKGENHIGKDPDTKYALIPANM